MTLRWSLITLSLLWQLIGWVLTSFVCHLSERASCDIDVLTWHLLRNIWMFDLCQPPHPVIWHDTRYSLTWGTHAAVEATLWTPWTWLTSMTCPGLCHSTLTRCWIGSWQTKDSSAQQGVVENADRGFGFAWVMLVVVGHDPYRLLLCITSTWQWNHSFLGLIGFFVCLELTTRVSAVDRLYQSC